MSMREMKRRQRIKSGAAPAATSEGGLLPEMRVEITEADTLPPSLPDESRAELLFRALCAALQAKGQRPFELWLELAKRWGFIGWINPA